MPANSTKRKKTTDRLEKKAVFFVHAAEPPYLCRLENYNLISNMKKIFLFFLSTVLLTGCSSEDGGSAGDGGGTKFSP